jgi:hypothetical protein
LNPRRVCQPITDNPISEPIRVANPGVILFAQAKNADKGPEKKKTFMTNRTNVATSNALTENG